MNLDDLIPVLTPMKHNVALSKFGCDVVTLDHCIVHGRPIGECGRVIQRAATLWAVVADLEARAAAALRTAEDDDTPVPAIDWWYAYSTALREAADDYAAALDAAGYPRPTDGAKGA